TLIADETIHEERGDSVERAVTTATSLDVEQDNGNINRTQSAAIPNDPFPQEISSGGSPMRQDTILGDTPTQNRLIKKGRKIAAIDQDPSISLVQHDAEIQGRYEHDMEFDITMAETLVYIRKSATKDKGKGKMDEYETVKTKTKLQQEQERLDFEAAVRLQAELDQEGRQRIDRVRELASSFNVEEWEDIQARVQTDEELVHRLQAEERENYTEAEQARMLAELINQRKRYFAAQRAKEKRNKPPTQAQQRTYMSNYIKHMGGYTLQQLSGYSFDEIKTLFETTIRSVNTFVLIESKVDRVVPELAAGSSKRVAEVELDQESSKRQKTGESSEQRS
ncbi:hypothetical protein Tco_1441652, partial [Tanacetum coccineum]